MLNTRLHVLIEESLARVLAARALQEKVSMGDLVRRAVRKEYIDNEQALKERKKLAARLLRLQKKYLGRFEGFDYRAAIEDGRTR